MILLFLKKSIDDRSMSKNIIFVLNKMEQKDVNELKSILINSIKLSDESDDNIRNIINTIVTKTIPTGEILLTAVEYVKPKIVTWLLKIENIDVNYHNNTTTVFITAMNMVLDNGDCAKRFIFKSLIEHEKIDLNFQIQGVYNGSTPLIHFFNRAISATITIRDDVISLWTPDMTPSEPNNKIESLNYVFQELNNKIKNINEKYEKASKFSDSLNTYQLKRYFSNLK